MISISFEYFRCTVYVDWCGSQHPPSERIAWWSAHCAKNGTMRDAYAFLQQQDALSQATWTTSPANLALIRGKQYCSNCDTNIVNYNYHHHQERYRRKTSVFQSTSIKLVYTLHFLLSCAVFLADCLSSPSFDKSLLMFFFHVNFGAPLAIFNGLTSLPFDRQITASYFPNYNVIILCHFSYGVFIYTILSQTYYSIISHNTSSLKPGNHVANYTLLSCMLLPSSQYLK
jgi:hypothetical protein